MRCSPCAFTYNGILLKAQSLDEIRDNVTRMRREWEAQRGALATVRRFNAILYGQRLCLVLAEDRRRANFKHLVDYRLRQFRDRGRFRFACEAS